VRSLPAMARARPPKMLPSQPKLSYAFVAADRRYTCDGGQAMDRTDDATDDDDHSYSDGPLPAVGYSVSMPTLGAAGSRRLPAGRQAAAAAAGLFGSPARRSLSPLRLANAAEPSLHDTSRGGGDGDACYGQRGHGGGGGGGRRRQAEGWERLYPSAGGEKGHLQRISHFLWQMEERKRRAHDDIPAWRVAVDAQKSMHPESSTGTVL
jgi:hypothetical protein